MAGTADKTGHTEWYGCNLARSREKLQAFGTPGLSSLGLRCFQYWFWHESGRESGGHSEGDLSVVSGIVGQDGWVSQPAKDPGCHSEAMETLKGARVRMVHLVTLQEDL